MSSSELQTASTLDRIAEIVRDMIGDETISLRPDTKPGAVKGWDSLANVSIMFGIEEEFGVTLGEDLVTAFETVGDLAAMINRRLGESAR